MRPNPDAPQDDNDFQLVDAAYDAEAPDGGHAADFWASIWPESVDDD